MTFYENVIAENTPMLYPCLENNYLDVII